MLISSPQKQSIYGPSKCSLSKNQFIIYTNFYLRKITGSLCGQHSKLKSPSDPCKEIDQKMQLTALYSRTYKKVFTIKKTVFQCLHFCPD